jgi:hypothetical protein
MRQQPIKHWDLARLSSRCIVARLPRMTRLWTADGNVSHPMREPGRWPSLKPVGYSWSHSSCRIGHWVPIGSHAQDPYSSDGVQVYRRLAAEDGIALDSAPHGVRDFALTCLPGDYRRVLHRPADLEWVLLRYQDADEPLAQADLDALQGLAGPTATVVASGVTLFPCGAFRCCCALCFGALVAVWGPAAPSF